MQKRNLLCSVLLACLLFVSSLTPIKAEENEQTEDTTVQETENNPTQEQEGNIEEDSGSLAEYGYNGYEDWIPDYNPKAREMYGGYSRNGSFFVANMSTNVVQQASNIKVGWATGGGVNQYFHIPTTGQVIQKTSNIATREYTTASGTFVLKRNSSVFKYPIFDSRFITNEVLPAGTYTVTHEALEFVELQKANGVRVWVAPQYQNNGAFIATNQGYFNNSKAQLNVTSINGKPIKQMMMPIREDKRTGIAMQPKYVTIHNTGSPNAGANAKAHANNQIYDQRKEVSWHYTVDNNEIYQSMPMNEVAYHAGDGQNIGNSATIGIEICENSDGNYAQAEKNAAYLTAQILYENGMPSDAVRMHKDWSGKQCAANIINGTKGTMGWSAFKNLVAQEYNRMQAENSPKELSVDYRTHIQKVGWQGYQQNGNVAGTSGQALRLEAINIKLGNNTLGGGIEYSTHVQSEGWQGFVKDNALSGTSGKARRLEAIKIRLYGNVANAYDVYYRVHSQSLGWLGWAKNGEVAGTAGLSYRLEAIQISLVPKGGAAPGSTTRPYVSSKVSYQTHIQTLGWQADKKNGEVAGTTGNRLRLEGIKIKKIDDIAGDVVYRTHVQRIGWQPFKKNGEMSGTSGQALRLEAIEINLTGDLANTYDIYYRVHSQSFGWLGWAKNGAPAGTTGYAYRLEGIQIMLVDKGAAAPGSTSNAFKQK